MNYHLSNRLVDIAKYMCPLNRDGRCSHVSFLLKKSKIIKIGWNKYRTNPQNLKYPYHNGNVGIHAEMDVIIKSGKDDLSDYDLVVIRIDRNGNMTNSKPCSGCKGVISQFGIREVWFSNINGILEKLVY